MILILGKSKNKDLQNPFDFLKEHGYNVSGSQGTCNNCFYNTLNSSRSECFKTVTVTQNKGFLSDKIILNYCSNWRREDFDEIAKHKWEITKQIIMGIFDKQQ